MASSTFHRMVLRWSPHFKAAFRASLRTHNSFPTRLASSALLSSRLESSFHGASIRELWLQKLEDAGQRETHAQWAFHAFPIGWRLRFQTAEKLEDVGGLVRRKAPVACADTFTVAMIACFGVAAAGGSYFMFFGPRDKIVKVSLQGDEVSYLGEGHSSILCAYVGSQAGWQGRLLQLAKESVGDGSGEDVIISFRRRTEIPRGLALHCFDPGVIDCPELVSLPTELIGNLDASFFSMRPVERRNQKLRHDERAQCDGRVLALRSRSLFEAPPRLRISWLRRAADYARSPLLTLEFRPGCGVQEVVGMPSRDALRVEAMLGGSSATVQQLDSLSLYSNQASRAVENLRARLTAPVEAAALRIFVDGRPVHPSSMPVESSSGTPEGQMDLPGLVRSCGIKCSVDDLLGAVTKALTSGRSPLADLRRLQCFAAGESEKIADRLFQDLQKYGVSDSVSSLSSIASMKMAIRRASRRESDSDRLDAHLKQGRKLMAISKWGDRQISDVKDWLSLFLLGRTCFEARVLVSFTVVQENIDAANLKQLRESRFRPLQEMLPGRPWSHNVWVCVTVTGLDRCCDPLQIPHLATELEELVRVHSESVAKR